MLRVPWLVPRVWPGWHITRFFSIMPSFPDPQKMIFWLKVISILWRIQSDLCSHVDNFGISCWMTSPGIVGLGRISWLASYLRLLKWVGEISISKEKIRKKGFPKKLIHSRKRVTRVFLHAFQKYPFQLDQTNHHGVTYLGIFLHRFSGTKNIFLPLWHPIF